MAPPQIDPIPVTPENLARAAEGQRAVENVIGQLGAAAQDILAPAVNTVAQNLAQLEAHGKAIAGRINRVVGSRQARANRYGTTIAAALTGPVQSVLDTVSQNSAALYDSVPEYSYHAGGPPANPSRAPMPMSAGVGATTTRAAGRPGAAPLTNASGLGSSPNLSRPPSLAQPAVPISVQPGTPAPNCSPCTAFIGLTLSDGSTYTGPFQVLPPNSGCPNGWRVAGLDCAGNTICTPIGTDAHSTFGPSGAAGCPAPPFLPPTVAGTSWFWCDTTGKLAPQVTPSDVAPGPTYQLVTSYTGTVANDPVSLAAWQQFGCVPHPAPPSPPPPPGTVPPVLPPFPPVAPPDTGPPGLIGTLPPELLPPLPPPPEPEPIPPPTDDCAPCDVWAVNAQMQNLINVTATVNANIAVNFDRLCRCINHAVRVLCECLGGLPPSTQPRPPHEAIPMPSPGEWTDPDTWVPDEDETETPVDPGARLADDIATLVAPFAVEQGAAIGGSTVGLAVGSGPSPPGD